MGGTCCVTLLPTSETGADILRNGNALYKPKECSRYIGAPLPPNGTPIPTHNLENLSERLERLAFPPPQPAGTIRPPIETCRITTSEHGDVYSATDEYVRWFRSAYPNAGGGDRIKRAQVGPSPETFGGEKTPLSHFKAT